MSHETLNTALLGIGILLILWLAVRSRDWQAPLQAARLDELDKRISILAGNLSRVTSQQSQFRHEDVEADHRIWEELKAIHVRLDTMSCPLGNPDCPLPGGE